MTVDPRVLLAVNVDRNIPSPQISNNLTVLFLGGIELGEAVALPVGGNIKGWEELLATGQINTSGQAVIVLPIHRVGAEEILSRSLKTSLETTCI